MKSIIHILSNQHIKLYAFAFILLVAFGISIKAQQSALPENYSSLSKEQKIDWLIENMGLEEKLVHVNTSPKGKKSYRQNFDSKYQIPGFVSCDGPRGVKIRGEGIVNFPSSLNLGASWDTSLARQLGQAYAEQLIYFKSNQIFSPGINIIRHPLTGRNNEYYSEDPILTGKLAAANIIGIQESGCIATPKHYVANNFEIGRFQIDVEIPERVLRESYLLAFQIAITEGKPWSIMSSYNSVNGNFLASNKKLLDIPANEWGWQGYWVTDYNAEFESLPAMVKAGTHVEMPGWKGYTANNMKKALASGELTMEEFNTLFRKVLEIKLSDWLPNPEEFGEPEIDLEKQYAIARKIGTESAVLLKNEGGLLPLKKEQTIALIGPFANSDLPKGLQGSSTNRTKRNITIKQALEEQGLNVEYALGATGLPDEQTAITNFAAKAEYFNNMHLEGMPALTRYEKDIQKISFTGTGAADITEGIDGNAFQFNGQSQLKIGQTPDIADNEDFTWSFWVYLPDQFPDKDGGLFAGYFRRWSEFTITPTYLDIFLFGPRKRVKLELNVSDQLWSHVCVVRNNGKISTWVNGKKIDEKPFAFPIPAAELVIGGSNVTDKNSNCYIDEVRLYSKALSAGEIAKCYSKNPVTTNVVLYESCNNVESVKKQLETFEGITDPTNLSARWTKSFAPEKTGKYFFNMFTNGGIRFYVNGEKMLDQWQEAWVKGLDRRAWVDMEAGKTYEITIEFANWYAHNRGKGGFLKFHYMEPYDKPFELIEEAKIMAANTNVALLAVGVPQSDFQGESNDLDHFYLPGYQNELIEAVASVNPNTVVMLFTAGGVDMRPWLPQVNGLVEFFHPGEEAGNVVSDILLGNANPSGKLSISYATDVNLLEAKVVQKEYEKNIAGFGYQYFDKKGQTPLFHFGYGLSYTSFKMKGLKVDVNENGAVTASLKISNTGENSGAEVVQVYASTPKNGIRQPVKELAGFAKVFLHAGETKEVNIELEPLALQYYNVEEKQWKLPAGEFIIQVGSSSDNLILSKKIEL